MAKPIRTTRLGTRLSISTAKRVVSADFLVPTAVVAVTVAVGDLLLKDVFSAQVLQHTLRFNTPLSQ